MATRQLTNIYLGGALGKRFGEKWTLAVSSPAEAIKAIDINLKGGLSRYLYTEGKNRYYKVALQRRDSLIGREELRNRSGNSDIYILPTVKGSNSGVGKIIVGVVLIVAAVLVTIGTFGTASPLVLAAADAAFGIGTSLVLGGISQLLAPHATNNQGELNSNSFAGAVAAGAQGGCVPIVYGKALVSPITISVWFNNIDYNTTNNTYVGGTTVAQLPGGGYQYAPNPGLGVTIDNEGD